MSHEVITCTCRKWKASLNVDNGCPVPGHGIVPADPVDPWTLVEAGREALGHLMEVERHLIAARSAWVSRGLPGDNPFPVSLDRETMRFIAGRDAMRKWVAAAEKVARERQSQT